MTPPEQALAGRRGRPHWSTHLLLVGALVVLGACPDLEMTPDIQDDDDSAGDDDDSAVTDDDDATADDDDSTSVGDDDDSAASNVPSFSDECGPFGWLTATGATKDWESGATWSISTPPGGAKRELNKQGAGDEAIGYRLILECVEGTVRLVSRYEAFGPYYYVTTFDPPVLIWPAGSSVGSTWSANWSATTADLIGSEPDQLTEGSAGFEVTGSESVDSPYGPVDTLVLATTGDRASLVLTATSWVHHGLGVLQSGGNSGSPTDLVSGMSGL